MQEYLLELLATAREQLQAMQSAIGPLRLTRYELMGLVLRKTGHDLALALSDAREVWAELSVGARSAILVVAVFLIGLLLDSIAGRLSSLRRRGIPVLKVPKGVHKWDYRSILIEGARRYPDTPYIIAYSGYEYVVYPSSSFAELSRLPAADASMIEWFTHVFFQGWRFLGSDNSTLHTTIRLDLSRAVPAGIQKRQHHARTAFDSVIGPCPEWKPVPLYSAVQEIVAITNTAGLFGADRAKDSRWLNAIQRFPIAIMVAVFASHSVPRLLRPVVSTLVFLPAWYLYWQMKSILSPMVEEELRAHEKAAAAEKDGVLDTTSPSSSAFPIASWLVKRYRPEERGLRQGAHDLIVAAFESIPSTAATLYFILAELVTHPEWIDELREEVSQNMVDGQLPLTQLAELQKLDSVMRESTRVNLFNHLTLFRKILRPMKLEVGPTLPRGSLVCVDAYHITASEKLWENPETFDPMRFVKLRQQPGHESLHQFTSLGADAPGWGGGPQACPGRVFAGNTIKIFLAHLLMNYDIELSKTGKPRRDFMPNGSVAPDMGARIMIRERKL